MKTQERRGGAALRKRYLAYLFFAFTLLGLGQAAPRQDKKPVTNTDVVGMVKAGLAESTVILAIQNNPTDFDISPDALISLKKDGVSEKILNTMLTARNTKPTGSVGKETTGNLGAALAPTHGQDKPEVKEARSPVDNSRTVLSGIRKVVLEGDELAVKSWRKRLERHTCLRIVDSREEADAILRFPSSFYFSLVSKDGKVLWGEETGFRYYSKLNNVVGCQK